MTGCIWNTDEDSTRVAKEVALRRWIQIAKNIPVATAFLVLLFVFDVVFYAWDGGRPAAELHGETSRNRQVIGATGILFSYIPVYVNLFVIRKCQKLFQEWEADERE